MYDHSTKAHMAGMYIYAGNPAFTPHYNIDNQAKIHNTFDVLGGELDIAFLGEEFNNDF